MFFSAFANASTETSCACTEVADTRSARALTFGHALASTLDNPCYVDYPPERPGEAAARKAVGGGRVTKVEHFNSGRVRWEIDVRRNGRSWEVKLSRTLRVLSKDLRHDGGGDDGPNHH